MWLNALARVEWAFTRHLGTHQALCCVVIYANASAFGLATPCRYPHWDKHQLHPVVALLWFMQITKHVLVWIAPVDGLVKLWVCAAKSGGRGVIGRVHRVIGVGSALLAPQVRPHFTTRDFAHSPVVVPI